MKQDVTLAIISTQGNFVEVFVFFLLSWRTTHVKCSSSSLRKCQLKLMEQPGLALSLTVLGGLNAY